MKPFVDGILTLMSPLLVVYFIQIHKWPFCIPCIALGVYCYIKLERSVVGE
jgi:hypothetical protein